MFMSSSCVSFLEWVMGCEVIPLRFPSSAKVYRHRSPNASRDQPICVVLRREANAVQESHSLGNSTSVLTVKAWRMMEEQDMMPLDEVVFVSIVDGGMA
jgi:hypothetical protein